MAFVEKNQSSMTMVMKVPEPGEPATGQDIKLFWLDPLAESIVRSMVSLHAASLGARHGSRFTRKFEEQTAWMAVNCSRVAVAAFMRIS